VLNTQREHDFQDALKNGKSVGNGAYARKGTALLVEKTQQPKLMVQQLRLALSKGPNRVGVSLPSPEDGNRCSFLHVAFSSF
jgi:hypothetical protein